MLDDTTADILDLTAKIIEAHLSHNPVAAEALPSLIQTVYRSLATAGQSPAAPAALTPAVPVKKSVFPDFLICLEDGQKLKTLKRHLATTYGMTPAQYREKWGLPANYPMVAPSYASQRSTLAKQIGLGRKPGALGPQADPEVSVLPARRAKGSKG